MEKGAEREGERVRGGEIGRESERVRRGWKKSFVPDARSLMSPVTKT